MYLLGHNAHLTQIQSQPVPADPSAGIAGSPGVVRWQGVVEAYVDEDFVDEVRQGQRVSFSKTIVDLPVNLPVWPNEEDIITLKRTGVLSPFSLEQPQQDTMLVRGIDGGLLMLGKLRVVAVRA